MPGLPQARVTDLHVCPLCGGTPLPVLPPCEVTVLVQKLPAARLGDLCAGGTPHPIVKGSTSVLIGKRPAARILVDTCAGGGVILPPAALTVLTGG